MPDCISLRHGKDENSCGSGKPSVICMCLTVARNVLIVWGDRFWHARYNKNNLAWVVIPGKRYLEQNCANS